MAVTINGSTGVTTNNSVYTDASGNTGIGTTSPSNKLVVSDNTAGVVVGIFNSSTTSGSSSSTLQLATNNGGNYANWNVAYVSAGGSYIQLNQAGVGTAFYDIDTQIWRNGSGTERMRIDSSGIVTGTAGNLMLVSGTSVSASGTSVEFTGIPSWVKRITLQLAGISTNGTAAYLVQIGSGSFTTSGYSSQSWASTGGGVVTSGFSIITAAQAALIYTGQIVLTKYTSNTWLSSGIVAITSTTSNAYQSSGYSSDLGAALDRVRITTVGGTNTFDAGTINILYE